jgi:hypothetical protein
VADKCLEIEISNCAGAKNIGIAYQASVRFFDYTAQLAMKSPANYLSSFFPLVAIVYGRERTAVNQNK